MCRAVSVAFKNLGFRFFKKPKKPKSLNFRFFRFFVSKNSNSFLSHILKVKKLELNNLNHIEFNHTLMTLFPRFVSRIGVLMDVFLGHNFVSGPRTLKPKKPKKTLKT